jgi:hypothetical protein
MKNLKRFMVNKMLSKYQKELVVIGVYSLFESKQPFHGYSHVLINNDDSGILVDNIMDNKKIENLDFLILVKIVTINDHCLIDSIEVQNRSYE